MNEYGNRSIPGKNANKEILKYYKDIGFGWVQDDDLAWCAGFMNWCLKKANKPFLKSLTARDFLKYGQKIKEPEMGDIVVLWRISPKSIYGHTGFYICERGNTVYILGGNQSEMVDIAPFPKTQILDYRRIV